MDGFPFRETLLFKDLSPRDQSAIAEISKKEKFKAGEVLFREGDPADAILLVQTGVIRITKGLQNAEITRIKTGEALGELAFLDQGARSATATALEETHVLKIPSDGLAKILDKNPALSNAFYRAAARYAVRRLRNTTEDLTVTKEFLVKNF